jgi:enediyne biosynthesis protein E4
MRTASIILLLAASVGGSIVLTQPESRPNTVRFTDITNSAHINFQHNNGASGKKYLPETLGAGCAFLDVMNQGWQDILLVNGESWPELNSGSATTLKLYRNNHNETSTDVTQAAGLSIPMYGMGVTVGDYDNDGYPDIFVTAVGHNHLFHNNGDGTFSDVTRKAGLWGDERFSTGAVWVDYDRDGYLDLFVANYVKWSPATDVFCTLDGKRKSYCNAEPYKGDSPRLYHNNRNGTFTDVTRESGVYKPTAKALGVTVVDVDGDGWPDLVLANDGEPDIFFHNNRNGTFEDAGELAGIGYAETGTPHLATGVDAADYDGSGRPSLVFTSAGRAFLYRNEGTGSFYEGRNFFRLYSRICGSSARVVSS